MLSNRLSKLFAVFHLSCIHSVDVLVVSPEVELKALLGALSFTEPLISLAVFISGVLVVLTSEVSS